MESLGEDLVLLAIRPDKGRIANEEKLGFGLMGSELVRLAAGGRVTVTDGRITVLNSAPTGDAELDAALASLAGARRPPKAQAWVGKPRRRICEAYQDRLARAGAVRIEERRFLGMAVKPVLHVTDAARVADARARLDAIALSSGPVDTAQAAYGGLAHATGVAGLLYPGRDGRQARERLAEVAKGTQPTDRRAPAEDAGQAATRAATSAAARKDMADRLDAVNELQDDVQTALQDAQAAMQAVHAANAAAVHAAVHAANHAASHAAAHGGGGGGGHGH